MLPVHMRVLRLKAMLMVFRTTLSRVLNTGVGDLTIGYNQNGTAPADFQGYMSDFRVYDVALSAAEILADSQIPVFLFRTTPWSTMVGVSWSAIVGASSYRITLDSGTGEEISFSDNLLETIIYNLDPLVTYTLRFYFTTDDVNYTLKTFEDFTTLSDVSSNSNLTVFNTGGVFDFTRINRFSIDRLQKSFNDTIPSGTTVVLDESQLDKKVKKNCNRFRLITRGSSSTVPVNESVMISFDPNEGASQTVSSI